MSSSVNLSVRQKKSWFLVNLSGRKVGHKSNNWLEKIKGNKILILSANSKVCRLIFS